MDSFTLTLWTGQCYIRDLWLVLISYLVESSELNANSVEPYQTPLDKAASDLALHRSQMYPIPTLGLNGLNK